jgi:16S rRNA (adenine1518-N6/adenine1519-N6)-dimethyltransferase
MNKSSKADFTKNKNLGQNFLIDLVAINNFLSFCNLSKNDTVLEIGIGDLALTEPMCKKATKVVAVEIDQNLIKIGESKINSLKNENCKLKIIGGDFLKLDLENLIKSEGITKIIAAIPYNITSPIIHKIIEEATPPLNNVFLITQKEFALKLIGTAKRRSYFTNLVEKYAKIINGQTIYANSFDPAPKVNSMYFGLKFFSYPNSIYEVKQWGKFLHHAFRSPRKKLNKAFDVNLLQQLEIDENKRPENLSITELTSLSEK